MKKVITLVTLICSLLLLPSAFARTKLVALPDRETTRIRLDHPLATLVEEERTLTLHKGSNQIDFSWNGVNIDPESIRLSILQPGSPTRLINVNYPPASQALVWEIHTPEGREEKVRISYLLANIDRVITYEAYTDKLEQTLDLSSFMVLRNFSGEDFASAEFKLDYGQDFSKSIASGETKRLLFFAQNGIAIEKWFTFDAGKLPWEPDRQNNNVGIPVHYELVNNEAGKLGQHALWGGKVRLFQNDGRGSRIFLGEDKADFTPVDKSLHLTIGDSRDIVVTQRKTKQQRKNVRRNRKNQIVLHDREETMQIEVENFKDTPARLKIIEPMSGEWVILDSTHPYQREHSSELNFEVTVPANEKLTVRYQAVFRNIRS